MATFGSKKSPGNDRSQRLVSGAQWDDDARLDASVRPKTLSEYIGQKRVKENISIALEAARSRDEALTFCSTVLPVSAKPLSRRSSPMNSMYPSKPVPALFLNAKAT